MKKILLSLLSILLFAACDVDFSPNAEWKEVPVVYCLLDQDDDTTFVRVQKCYLGEDNLYSYSSIYDSINYPEGALDVQILKYPAAYINGEMVLTGAPPVRLDFEYALRYDKEEGEFSYPAQPVYRRCTAGELDDEAIYKLLVIKKNTGDTIASATTSLIFGDGAFYFLKPTKLNFMPAHKCDFLWKPMSQGRLYQPKVRFYYFLMENVPGTDSLKVADTAFVDVLCSKVRNVGYNEQMSATLMESTFLLDVQNALKDDPTPKGFYDTCDIYLYICNEDFTAYLNSTSTELGVQGRQPYTNIENGLGVFGSRRTHIYSTMPTDNAVGSQRLHAKLKELNVGF